MMFTTTLFAQKKWSFTGDIFASSSFFSINKKSTLYNDGWEQVNLTFKSKWGYGAGVGLEYKLTDRFALFGKVRYHDWGGYIHAIKNDPEFYLDLNINYQSINIPFGISFIVKKRTRLAYIIKAGGGIDNSYKLAFTPNTYYTHMSGNDNTLTSNIDIKTIYVLLGGELTYQLTPKYILYLGLELNNDMLFNGEWRKSARFFRHFSAEKYSVIL